jgi:glycosyltransferase involved in cell wall biosynthesis
MTVLTGIDLPYPGVGGSVELLRDLYSGPAPLIPADVFMLDSPEAVRPVADGGPVLLPVPGKALAGDAFRVYVELLATAVAKAFCGNEYAAVHLQHLAFGATAALLRVFPDVPKIALVHGTDLLFAEEYPTQAEVLRQAAAAADVVVVPTAAMADRLLRVAPSSGARIVQVPWGVPDALLDGNPAFTPRPEGVLRVLYAGRLTAEKATSEIIASVAGLDGIELSVAAPPAEFAALADRSDLSGVRYCGWLSRDRLWSEFAEHDVLMVPSRKLEAFGLVAVEAQACGLPVIYQPVPGLAEVLRDSAVAVDFGDMPSLALRLKELRTATGLLEELRAAGLANSARFPLSATARSLAELSKDGGCGAGRG